MKILVSIARQISTTGIFSLKVIQTTEVMEQETKIELTNFGP